MITKPQPTPEERKKKARGLRRYFVLAFIIAALWLVAGIAALILKTNTWKAGGYIQIGGAIIWLFVAWRGYVAAQSLEEEAWH